MTNKHILIIGGMGPQASVYAHHLLLEEFQKTATQLDNSDYPRITHLSINVDDFISDPSKKESSLQYILRCLGEVDLNSVTVGFIACNTAHLIFDDIQKTIDGKLISVIDTVKACVEGRKVGLVATPVTITSRLYDMDNIITPDDSDFKNIELIIRQVISDGPSKNLAHKLEAEVIKLKSKGAEEVILGCSELSILGRYLELDYVVDPMSLIVKKVLS